MNILKALKRSSLGLDLYLWVSYRTFTLKRPLRLSWKKLYRQFGSEPTKENDKNTVNRFRIARLARVEEDQAGLAVSELLDGQGRVDPLALQARHCSGAAAIAWRIAIKTPFPAQKSFVDSSARNKRAFFSRCLSR